MAQADTLSPALTVTTEAGQVRGTGDGVRVFKGIPYAAAPVGDLRWRAPQRAPRWEGVRDASEFGPDCPQKPRPDIGMRSRAKAQSEDCLSLNIWTPAKTAQDKLPVMVWFYGGSFIAGSASDARTDGDTFSAKGVILITVNYRTGMFGFLAHPELTRESPHKFSSNYSLLDQIEALRWIRDNIAAFGGDPQRVTVFGVSAGSASLTLLMTSPLAQGLFQQAILQSPGTFRPLASLAAAEAAGAQLGDDIAALRRLSPEELMEREHLLVPKMRGLTTPRILRPIRDGYVIREDEREAYYGGRFMNIPIIIGTMADEGSSMTTTWPVKTRADWDKVVAENFPQDGEGARRIYAVDSDAAALPTVGQVFADTQFNYGVWGLARSMAKKQKKTFRYVFTRRRPGVTDGPHHGEDVVYAFNHLSLAASATDATDARIASAVQDAWVRFAATGDPNGGDLPAWPAYTAETDAALEFADAPRVISGWRKPQMDFLEGFFDRKAKASA